MINKYIPLLIILLLGSRPAFGQRSISADVIRSNSGSGSICVPASITLDCFEVSYLDGVTSSIQTQLNGKQALGNYITGLTGDVSAAGPGSVAATINSVGGSTAANVNTATIAVNVNATAAATSNTLVKRDGFASAAFGAVTASGFTGDLTNASTINTKPVVDYYNDALAVEGATASATSNTIAKRDGFGQLAATGFYGGDLNGNITGTASNVTGVVAIANGGTGQSNQQAGLNNITDIASHSNGDVLQLLGGNAQFAPLVAAGTTGTPNTPTYYDGAGNLGSIPGYSINSNYYGWSDNLSYDSPDGEAVKFLNQEAGIENSASATGASASGIYLDMHHNRATNNQPYGDLYWIRGQLTLEGASDVNYSSAIEYAHVFGDGVGGSLQNGNGFNQYTHILNGYSVVGTYNSQSLSVQNDGTVENLYMQNLSLNGSGTAHYLNGINLGVSVTSVLHDVTLINANINSAIGGSFNGQYLSVGSDIAGNASMLALNYYDKTVTGNFNFLGAVANSAASVGGDYRALQLGSDMSVGGNGAGALIFQNGTVSKAWTGFGSYVNADVGDDASFISGVDVNFQNHTINGGMTAFNFSNNSNVIGTNPNLIGMQINNAGTGYRFSGVGVYNQSGANMSEEIKGYDANLQGNARTGVGYNLSIQGAYTDDVHGIRISMDNATLSSTSNHVMMGEFSGGNFSVNGLTKVIDNATVDIGNYISSTTEIQAGSAPIGTDFIQQIIQSNLLLHDTINPGPFGLGVNATGIVPQVGLDSGVTLPYYRTLLLGTSVPQGSGGTITDAVNAELVGFLSFGGSVTVTNLAGLQDGQLIGQQFCDLATNCWFMRVRDARAETSLPKLAINTASQKVSANVGLEINDKHVKISGTNPTPTVDANAGTGATCTANGTDSDGIIDIEMGSAAWAAGSQCSLAFVHAYNSNPVCTFSPTNGAAATAATIVQPWVSTSTTDLVLFFVNADTVSNEYTWAYHCIEVF